MTLTLPFKRIVDSNKAEIKKRKSRELKKQEARQHTSWKEQKTRKTKN